MKYGKERRKERIEGEIKETFKIKNRRKNSPF